MQITDLGINDRVKRPINELILISVLASSKGNLLYSYQLTNKIQTVENPAFHFNELFSNEYQMLIQIFSSRAISILEASTLAGRFIFDTINFVNACAITGKNTVNA